MGNISGIGSFAWGRDAGLLSAWRRSDWHAYLWRRRRIKSNFPTPAQRTVNRNQALGNLPPGLCPGVLLRYQILFDQGISVEVKACLTCLVKPQCDAAGDFSGLYAIV